MAQNDIRRLSVGNGRVIELKEDSGALFARETSEWGFEEVFDLTTLPGYDAGRRATYRINAGNIERREAQETAWEAVMSASALTLTPVEAGGGGGGGMTLVYAATINSDGTVANEYENGLSGTWAKESTGEYIFTSDDITTEFLANKYLCIASVSAGGYAASNATSDLLSGSNVAYFVTGISGVLTNLPFSVLIYTFPPAE